jgi:hypothetical protein
MSLFAGHILSWVQKPGRNKRIRCGNSPLGRDAQPHKGTGVQGRDWQDP